MCYHRGDICVYDWWKELADFDVVFPYGPVHHCAQILVHGFDEVVLSQLVIQEPNDIDMTMFRRHM